MVTPQRLKVALAGGVAAAAFLARAGGEPRGTLGALARSRPQVALALGLSGGAATRGGAAADLVAYCFAGRGECREYIADGRLTRDDDPPT